MIQKLAPLAAALLAGALLPAAAQPFDPGLGAEALRVDPEGAIVVRNGDRLFRCALETTDSGAALADCRPVGAAMGEDVAARLAAFSEADWQALVREALLDADCRLSAFGGVAQVLATAAAAQGMPPEAIDRMRADLAPRAEAAVAAMIRQGLVSYRGGELALDDCP
jgi:hypothetical protein